MRAVWLLLAFCTVAMAQIIPEPELIELGDNNFTICSPKTASGGIVNMRVKWSDDAIWTSAEWEQCHSNTSGGCTTNIFALNDAAPRACVYVTNVPEGDVLLVHVNFWNGSAWTSDTDSTYQTNIQAAGVCAAFPSNCTDIDADGGGAGTDRVLQITTTSDGAVDTPDLPVHDRTFSAVGTIDDEVEVTVTGGECDDLQAKLTSQTAACIAAASSAVTYAVKIPAGITCYPEDETAGALDQYSIPDITDTDCTLLVYSESADPDVDPPDGGLIAPDTATGVISQNLGLPTNVAALTLVGSGQQNVRLRNIVIRRPAAKDTDYPEVNLTGWSNASQPVVTFASAITAEQWGDEFSVYFPNAETIRLRTGLKNAGNDATAADWVRQTSTTYQFNDSSGEAETASTEAGVASRDVTREFTSATAASQPVLTFGANLNYASGAQYALAATNSINAGVITTSAGAHAYAFGSNADQYGILVQGATGTGGTTDAECNTLHRVNGRSTSSGTWDITDSDITCNGGTAEMPLKVWVHDMSGYTYSAMSCLATVVTQTTAKLWSCQVSDVAGAFTPDFTGMTVTGYMALGFREAPPLLDIGSATGVTVESVLFDAGGAPWSTLYAIDADDSADDLIVIGSWFKGGYHSSPIDPISGSAHLQNRANNNNFFQAYKCRQCTDTQFINNVMETDQSLVLTTDGPTVTQPSDFTVSGLVYKIPDYLLSHKAASGGLWSPGRQQPMEFKNGGTRLLGEGMAIANQKHNVTGSPAALLCQTQFNSSSTIDYVSKCDHITFRNNYVRGSQAVFVDRVAPGNAVGQYTAHGPVLVDNNFIAPEIIFQKPTGDTGFTDSYPSFFVPNAVRIGRSRDVTVSNNTFAWQQPQVNISRDYNVFLDISSLTTAAFTNTGNVYVDMDASSSNQNHFILPTSFSWANYEATSLANGVFSTLGTHSGNRTVACTIAPTTVDFDTANAAHTEASGRLTAAGGSMATNWPLTPLSADSQSCNTRLDEVFTAGTWEPSGSEGADIDAILDAIGQVRAVTVTATGITTASVQFEPWSTSAVCELGWKAGPVTSFSGETGVTKVATGTGKPRTVNLTGLPANTVIDVQIQCDRGLPVYVLFETN